MIRLLPNVHKLLRARHRFNALLSDLAAVLLALAAILEENTPGVRYNPEALLVTL